jgi:hypothetical protein
MMEQRVFGGSVCKVLQRTPKLETAGMTFPRNRNREYSSIGKINFIVSQKY